MGEFPLISTNAWFFCHPNHGLRCLHWFSHNCLFWVHAPWSGREGGGNNEVSMLVSVEKVHGGVLTGKIHLSGVFRRSSQYCLSLHCFNWRRSRYIYMTGSYAAPKNCVTKKCQHERECTLLNESSKLHTYSRKTLLKNLWLCVRKSLQEHILRCNHRYSWKVLWVTFPFLSRLHIPSFKVWAHFPL